MSNSSPSVKQAVVYDFTISLLYTWCVFQSYTYDAKTRTTGILVYLLTYGMFTLLVRSFLGVLVMNFLSGISLLFIFTVPVIQQAGSYFSFQPFTGFGATFIVFLLQSAFAIPLMVRGKRFLSMRFQYLISGAVAAVFTLVLTIAVMNTPFTVY